MENWSEISQSFIDSLTSSDEKGKLINVIHEVVMAYAGSANCNPAQIPFLYANLFALLTKGTLNVKY